jgi:hypothetical protein
VVAVFQSNKIATRTLLTCIIHEGGVRKNFL